MRHNMHQKGQVTFGLEEITLLDTFLFFYNPPESNIICAFIGDYTSFPFSKKKQELKHSKHYIYWQPKDGLPIDFFPPVVEALKDDVKILRILR